MPPPLLGSRESLLRQNERADQEGLKRVADEAMLSDMVQDGVLVPLPVDARLSVDPRLEPDRRYCRPWTARFLSDLAGQFYARFQTELPVDSAVRTVDYQRHLLRINANAAPAEGDTRSPHLTGEAVDIGKKGLSRSEIGWLRAYLLPLQDDGKIDVEEEFHQACFHISVYQSYAPLLRTAPSIRTASLVHTAPTVHTAPAGRTAPLVRAASRTSPRRSTRRHRRRTTPLLAARLP